MRFCKSFVFSVAVLAAGCATGPTVSEGLNRRQIQEPIEANVQNFVNCYADRLKSKPKLQGKVVVAFLINQDGNVSESRVVTSTMNDQATEQCISSEVRKLEFDSPKGKVLVKVQYPFQFKRNKNLALQ